MPNLATEIFRDLYRFTYNTFDGWSHCYSMSSGRTGCFNGMIDFFCLSRDSALRMSETGQKAQVRRENRVINSLKNNCTAKVFALQTMELLCILRKT